LIRDDDAEVSIGPANLSISPRIRFHIAGKYVFPFLRAERRTDGVIPFPTRFLKFQALPTHDYQTFAAALGARIGHSSFVGNPTKLFILFAVNDELRPILAPHSLPVNHH